MWNEFQRVGEAIELCCRGNFPVKALWDGHCWRKLIKSRLVHPKACGRPQSNRSFVAFKRAVHALSLCNLNELLQFCKDEWRKIAVCLYLILFEHLIYKKWPEFEGCSRTIGACYTLAVVFFDKQLPLKRSSDSSGAHWLLQYDSIATVNVHFQLHCGTQLSMEPPRGRHVCSLCF